MKKKDEHELINEAVLNWREMPRAAQVIIFVLSSLDKLKDMGIIEGGQYSSTPQSLKMAEEMLEAAEAGTWEPPTMEETYQVIATLQAPRRDPPTLQ